MPSPDYILSRDSHGAVLLGRCLQSRTAPSLSRLGMRELMKQQGLRNDSEILLLARSTLNTVLGPGDSRQNRDLLRIAGRMVRADSHARLIRRDGATGAFQRVLFGALD